MVAADAAEPGTGLHAGRTRVARAGGRTGRLLAGDLRRDRGRAEHGGAGLGRSREAVRLHEELAERSAEFELLYAISEILGQTVRLEEATQIIAREVSTVVGARRASIMVYDPAGEVLRTVAARGFGVAGLEPVPVDDECSIAARVYRERRVVAADSVRSDPSLGDCGEDRGYRGQAFLSVPICSPTAS